MLFPTITVPKTIAKSILQGHPWVYADPKLPDLPPVGTPLRLVNSKGKNIAFGIVDEGSIVVRVLGTQPDSIPNLLRREIQSAALLRRRIIDHSSTTCYRMINGPGDGLPGIVVDRYNDLAVLRLYGKCWEPWLKDICVSLLELHEFKSVFRRFGVRRVDGSSGGRLLAGEPFQETLIVTENGLKFVVRPRVGQKTGLFLDQREHRAHIGRIANQHTVANLFSYTGGFSVYAAAGGAKRVFSVDISKPAIEDAKENFRLNGLDPDKHIFLAADAFQWESPEPLSLLICDPPSLSHDHKKDSNASKAYEELATHCAKQLRRGDLLATASCTSRLSQSKWENAVAWGLKRHGRWAWLWRAAEPPDHPVSTFHPEGRYLKFSIAAKMR